MKLLTIFSAILFICLYASSSSADIYSWVDKNGITHFTNYSPPPAARLILKDVPVPRSVLPDKEEEGEGEQLREGPETQKNLEADRLEAKRKEDEPLEEAPYSSGSDYPNVNYRDESTNSYVSRYPPGFHRYPPELLLLRHHPNYHFKYHLDKPFTKPRHSAFRLEHPINKPTIWDRKALLRQKNHTVLGRKRVFGRQTPKAKGRPSAFYFAFGGGHYLGTSIRARGHRGGRAFGFGGKGHFGGGRGGR